MSRFVTVLCICIVAQYAFASNLKDGMMFVSFRVEPAAAGMNGQSYKLWVARDKYMRLEEPVDTAQKVQMLVVVAEPDCWMVNQSAKQGMHMVDAGPTLVVRPVVFGSVPFAEVRKLEFGQEQEFFKKHNAVEVPERTIDSIAYPGLLATVDSTNLLLFYDKRTKTPKLICMVRGTDTSKVIYEKYQTKMAVDTTLFMQPDSVQMTERQ